MIPAIVFVVSAITVAAVGTAAMAASRLFSLEMPIAVWICCAMVTDGFLIYAVFDRRAPIWGRIVSRGRPRSPAIAITFDDGPTEPYTSQILDVLRGFDAKATFFVLGARADVAPHVVRRIANEGHEVGNHTWDHAALPLRTPSAVRKTISRTSDLVEQVTGRRPRVFRAPFGWRNPWVDGSARREGCEPIAWTVGVHDTDRPGADAIVTRAVAGMVNGSILLLHDGRSLDAAPDASQVVEALPRIVGEAQRRGFRLLTMSALLLESRS
jgi:peptidoglycan/xylan/chitin deacetylase (PgdA/CDA1 family)